MTAPPFGNNAGPPLKNCPRCGMAIGLDARFCGNCGTVLAAPGTAQAPVHPPPVAPAPAPPPVAAPAMPRPPGRGSATMIGMPATRLPTDPAPVAPTPGPAPTAPLAAPVAAPHARTMIGVAPVALPAPASAPAPAKGPMPQAVRNAQQTMMGMHAVVPPAGPAPSAGNVGAPPGVPANPGPRPVANLSQTMMGMAAVSAPGSPVAAPMPMPAPTPPRARVEPPPMMGGPSPGVPADSMPPPSSAATSQVAAYPTPGADYLTTPSPPPRRSLALPVTVAVVTLGLVGGLVGFLLLKREHAEPPALAAEIQPDAAGALAMVVTVPDAPPGTAVRHGGQTQALDAQHRARFQLRVPDDRVGTFDVPVEVARPGAAPEARVARVGLAYRVTPDLAGLAGDPPGLRLVFHVPPHAQLTVNNQVVATDPRSGLGAATIDHVAPLPVDGPDVLASPFQVRVAAPDGSVVTGVYQLRVPRTALVVERPGAQTVTAASQVVVRGTAPGARRVTVDGAPVVVTGNDFAAVAPLPALGRHTFHVVAYSPAGAPASAQVDVERVAANDRAAVARFLGPNPAGAEALAHGALATGVRARLRGRMLGEARDHAGGKTFQLVVTDRPCEGSRCLVWVDAEPGVVPAADARIEVVGTVTGRRQSETEGGERRSDPVVTAAFLR